MEPELTTKDRVERILVWIFMGMSAVGFVLGMVYGSERCTLATGPIVFSNVLFWISIFVAVVWMTCDKASRTHAQDFPYKYRVIKLVCGFLLIALTIFDLAKYQGPTVHNAIISKNATTPWSCHKTPIVKNNHPGLHWKIYSVLTITLILLLADIVAWGIELKFLLVHKPWKKSIVTPQSARPLFDNSPIGALHTHGNILYRMNEDQNFVSNIPLQDYERRIMDSQ